MSDDTGERYFYDVLVRFTERDARLGKYPITTTVAWTLVYRQNVTNLTAASSWFPDPPADGVLLEGAPDPWVYNSDDSTADTFNVLGLSTDGRFDNPPGTLTIKMVWPDVSGVSRNMPLTLSSTWRQANAYTHRYVVCRVALRDPSRCSLVILSPGQRFDGGLGSVGERLLNADGKPPGGRACGSVLNHLNRKGHS